MFNDDSDYICLLVLMFSLNIFSGLSKFLPFILETVSKELHCRCAVGKIRLIINFSTEFPILQASLGEPVALQNVSKGRVPYSFAKLMGHTLINEQILIGHKVPTSQLDCLHSASEVFNHARYTKTVSASLKAMSLPNGMSYDDCLQTHCAADSFSELEQQLLEEEKKARNECIDNMKAFWKEVHSPLDV